MCEKMYRVTLLRSMFSEITSSGAIACAEGCEEAVASVAEPRPGFSYLRYDDAEQERSQLERGDGFLAMGGYVARIQSLSRLVEMARGQCTPAADDVLIVPLRMGDVLPSTPEVVIRSVQTALASPSMHGVRMVIFNAVMHYGNNKISGNFMRTAKTDDNNLHFVNRLSTLAKKHLSIHIRFRSEPSVDKDLCYLVHSPRVLIAKGKRSDHGGSFPLLVGELRSRAEGAQRHTLSTEAPWPMVTADAMENVPQSAT
jgi:hypothetical protein